MKKTYLLILSCCISSITIFGSDRTESSEEDYYHLVNKQQNREARLHIDHWNYIDYEKKEAVRKAKEQMYRESYNEIAQLKKEHKREIALYKQKIATLMAEREQRYAENRTAKLLERTLEDNK